MNLFCKCGAKILNDNIWYSHSEFDYEPDGMCGTNYHCEAECPICKVEYVIEEKDGELSNKMEAMISLKEDFPELILAD